MLDDIQHSSLSSMESDFASPDAQLNVIYKLDMDTSHWVIPVKGFSLANTNFVGREDELRPLPWPSFAEMPVSCISLDQDRLTKYNEHGPQTALATCLTAVALMDVVGSQNTGVIGAMRTVDQEEKFNSFRVSWNVLEFF
jgi:hypothetical protein